MDVRWLQVAVHEARDARRFYDEQRASLGSEFLAELETAIERIRSYPKAWPLIDEPVRRTVVNRFPYLVHYLEDDRGILVIGVYHSRRAPISWQRRLKSGHSGRDVPE